MIRKAVLNKKPRSNYERGFLVRLYGNQFDLLEKSNDFIQANNWIEKLITIFGTDDILIVSASFV